MPFGRDRLDWEIELATVIGRPARYVPATQAQSYVFGYTILNDLSARDLRRYVRYMRDNGLEAERYELAFWEMAWSGERWLA